MYVMNDLSATALATANEKNLFEYYKLFRHWTGAEVHDEQDLLWVISDFPSPFFNIILNAQITQDQVDITVEAIVKSYKAKNAFALWRTGPLTKPSNLGTYLEKQGFVHTGDSPGMAVDLSALNEELPLLPGLVIQQVSDVETLYQWSHIFSMGFGRRGNIEDPLTDLFASIGLGDDSPIQNFIGWLDGKPVASSQVFLGAGVAGIYDVATLPEARRQGCGAALSLAALLWARSLGYRVGTLQSSQMGFGIYSRIGFREHFKFSNYMLRNRT